MQISVEELKQQQAATNLTIIDVREPSEFAQDHIDGAENIPLGELADKVGVFDKTSALILVCHSGQRSLQATNFLRSVGFTGALNLSGGMLAWNNADQN